LSPPHAPAVGSARVVAGVIAAGLAMELIGLAFHARDMRARGNEGAVAHHEQTTTFFYTYWARNILLAGALAIAVALGLTDPSGSISLVLWGALALMAVVGAVVGRTLFYVLVVPTTMPGAFFWKNKGFEEHARATGLAVRKQVGVVHHAH
jgi:hypothetical protein